MYKCIVCDKEFKSNRTLKNHLQSDSHVLRMKNPERFLSCDCGKSFQYKQGLSRHKQGCNIIQEKKKKKDNLPAPAPQENADLTATITSLRAQICSLEKKLEQAKTQTTLVQHGRRKINQKIRETIATNQDHKCNDCKNTLTKYFQIDHLIGLQYGGTDETDNLQALCGDCHTKKSVIENRVRRKIQDAIRDILQEEEESS